jgi:hypothetical protein
MMKKNKNSSFSPIYFLALFAFISLVLFSLVRHSYFVTPIWTVKNNNMSSCTTINANKDVHSFDNALGLQNNPSLSLNSPIRAPLLEIPSLSERGSPRYKKKLKQCLSNAITSSQIPTLTSEGYYRHRYQQCNPYNGNYCQCTNNYIPLPTIGICQTYNRGMEVCPYPYKVSPRDLYLKATSCMAKP